MSTEQGACRLTRSVTVPSKVPQICGMTAVAEHDQVGAGVFGHSDQFLPGGR